MSLQRIYVKGTVRKDAVEITPKEVAIAEAMVLEAIYGEAWVPTRIRAVDVDEVPSPTAELDRLKGAYGAEAVGKAFGTDIAARTSISALLKLDSAAAAKESGVIPETEGVTIVAEEPVKGTKVYAQRAAAEAHPDDLKPVTGDPNDTASTAAAQVAAQQAEDDRRAAQQKAADDRRQQIADEASASKKASDEVNADNSTKADMQAELDKRGVEYPASATKADLQQLLDDNPAKTDENQG